jgi:hypothetical protein
MDFTSGFQKKRQRMSTAKLKVTAWMRSRYGSISTGPLQEARRCRVREDENQRDDQHVDGQRFDEAQPDEQR